MAWDTTREVNGELTNDDWNDMVTDQKSRALSSELVAHTSDTDIHFSDAPSDGNQYVRIDGAWAQVSVDDVTWGNLTGDQSTINISGFTNDSGFITGYTVTSTDVTQHEEDLSLTKSQITDLPEPAVESDITAMVDVGAIDAQDTITAGTTITEFLQQLLLTTFYPTFVNPSDSLSINISYNVEAGYQTSATLTASFNRGAIKGDMVGGVWDENETQDYRAGAVDYYVIDGTNTGSSNTKSLGTYQVTDGANSWSSTVYYLQGPQPKDSTGADYDSPYPAGNMSASKTIYGRRNLFYGYSNDGDTSSAIRSLQSSSLNPSNGTSFTINIPSGATNVVIAYPATLRDINSIQYEEGLNAEIKDSFVESAVNVEGANGYTAISYKVYIFTPVEPFSESATYNCQI